MELNRDGFSEDSSPRMMMSSARVKKSDRKDKNVNRPSFKIDLGAVGM